MVEPFMYGRHLHYEGMSACGLCAYENAVWDSLNDKFTSYELAKKVAKIRAYKVYRQAKPFDDYERVLSLDQLLDNGLQLPDDSEPLLDVYARGEAVENFKLKLSPRQLHIFNQLLKGKPTGEISLEEGFRSTGGVRYHKHVIRRKYRGFRG